MIFSVGFAFAEDVNQTGSDLDVTDGDVMSTLEICPSIILLDDEVTRTFNSDMFILIAFSDDDGDALNNTVITGNIDGKNITLGQTNENGVLFIHNLNLNIGSHVLFVSNPVTDDGDIMIINIVSRFANANNIVMNYFDGTSFKVRVFDDFANPVAKGQKVTITIKNKHYTALSDANGYVSFKIPDVVTPGTYTLKAEFQGQTISKTVKVKQNLKTKKYTVKKSAKKLVIKATLKNGNKAVKSKKLTLKVKGKKITAKTNKKGVAKFTIKKSLIKKLKAGKKYTAKITYLKNTIKTTIKVKR